MSKKEKILIFGGSGFIGTHFVQLLISQNEEVIVYDRIENKIGSFQNNDENLIFIKGDITNLEQITSIFLEYKISKVLYLISTVLPNTSLEKFQKEVSVNILALQSIIEIMLNNNVKNLIFLSSGGTVYGENNSKNSENQTLNPRSIYGWLKISLEKYIMMVHNISDLDYLIIRPSNAYGKYHLNNGQQGIIPVVLNNMIENKSITIFGDGENIRDYIYIEDLCEISYALWEKDYCWNNIFNVGSGVGLSLNDLLYIIQKTTKHSIEINYIEERYFDVKSNVLDISKLHENLGEIEFTPIEEGIDIIWQYYKNKNYVIKNN